MRCGIIESIDLLSGSGKIIDENDQEIRFFYKKQDQRFVKSVLVSFEIELTRHGLTAVQVRILNDIELFGILR